MGRKNDDDSSVESNSKMDRFEIEESGGSKGGFPWHVGYILGNEFCERYSYYGMRTVLVIYLTSDIINWDDNTATAVYHAFTVLAYLFPLLGAMLADSSWGKYWTILWLSIVYAIGSGINMMSSIYPIGGSNTAVHAALASVGLFVIAFGTGGIKPCVSAFGGDQFSKDQETYRKSFFSLFYFAINAGSLVSTFVSPLIREEVQCWDDDCYALAFGVPTALMVVAIILFVIGTKHYVRLDPQGNVFLQVSKTIWKAMKNRSKTPSKLRNKEHWLDYADDGTNTQNIQDIKYVLRVLIIFIPLPLFWSLFDQQGSRWTLQAVRMNGNINGTVILPDQFQICNPLIIVTLIPIFEATLYPFLRRRNINFTPLKRMGLGMWLAGLAFVVAALVQMMIDENLTAVPRSDQTTLRVLNGAECTAELKGDIYGWDSNPATVVSGNASDTLELMTSPGNYDVVYQCEKGSASVEVTGTLIKEEAFDLVLYGSGLSINGGSFIKRQTQKSNSGKAYVSVANAWKNDLTVKVPGQEAFNGLSLGMKHEFEEVSQGKYQITVEDGADSFVIDFEALTGAAYTILIYGKNKFTQFKDIYENDVNLFWMVPQYFIITLGEVFLSVTGLEFAYSQAPQSMKSVLQSFWLLTVSIGNIIVLIVAESSLIPNQADEYFLFAGLIAAAAILFMVLAINYEYVDESMFADRDSSSISGSSDSDSRKWFGSRKEDYAYNNSAFDKNTKM